MGITGALLTALFIYTLLIDKVDVRLDGTKDLSLTISLSLFAIELKNLNSGRRKGKLKLSKSIKRASFSLSVLSILLKRTEVHIAACEPFELRFLQSDPKLTLALSTLPILVGHLKRNAFCYTERSDGEGIDVTFSFYVADLFISLLIALYYRLRTIIKKGTRNAWR